MFRDAAGTHQRQGPLQILGFWAGALIGRSPAARAAPANERSTLYLDAFMFAGQRGMVERHIA
ncbi:hypothetical protein MNO14_09505 [Luteimonas sp. S4-F44]|uniref:hypothetical protein n=1 Tax=Luteimonas sp. S4-F44 TaxID=2925842 RepID=UPI001F531674|nr:hypothetical protein [Luteimonas sp. S4-F44]UNK41220.1 hypothetical protein MNO14_09505 [Luteimonas sp. S4-F44]